MDISLKRIGDLWLNTEDQVFDQAVRWCSSTDADDRCFGACVLGGLAEWEHSPYYETSISTLRQLFDDVDEVVLAAAINALGSMSAYDALVDALRFGTHPSGFVRSRLAMALSGHEHPDAIATLISLTRDPVDDVRESATFALASQIDICSAEICQALYDRTDESDEDIRDQALVGLARCGDRRAVPLIEQALASEHVSSWVIEAAARAHTPELVMHLEKLEDRWRANPDLMQLALISCRTGSLPDNDLI